MLAGVQRHEQLDERIGLAQGEHEGAPSLHHGELVGAASSCQRLQLGLPPGGTEAVAVHEHLVARGEVVDETGLRQAGGGGQRLVGEGLDAVGLDDAQG